MRLENLSIEVEPGPHGPTALRARGRVARVVRILDAWRLGGRWWLGETPRRHYRLELDDGRVVEVSRGEDGWRLTRASD